MDVEVVAGEFGADLRHDLGRMLLVDGDDDEPVTTSADGELDLCIAASTTHCKISVYPRTFCGEFSVIDGIIWAQASLFRR